MFQSHSETSKTAFDHIDEPGQLEDVMRAFQARGPRGATCEEILLHMVEFMPHRKSIVYGTVSARMGTLKTLGRIFYKNETRPTTSGKPAEVWVHESFATEAEKLFTAEKAKPNKEVALEKIENAKRFLIGMEKSKCVPPVWLSGMRHNVAELTAALELLK